MHPFNAPDNRDPRMPDLTGHALAFMEEQWHDDYESWGLVNPDEDPTLFTAVLVLIGACAQPEKSGLLESAKADIKALLYARNME